MASTSPPKRQRAFSKRSRSGCFTCRRRRVKCDELRPTCKNCERGGRECVFPAKPNLTNTDRNMQKTPPTTTALPSLPVNIHLQQQQQLHHGQQRYMPNPHNVIPPPNIFQPPPPPSKPPRGSNNYQNTIQSYPPTPVSSAPSLHHVYHYPVAHVPSIYKQQQQQQQQPVHYYHMQQQQQQHIQPQQQQQQQPPMAMRYQMYTHQQLPGYVPQLYTPAPPPVAHGVPLTPPLPLLPMRNMASDSSQSSGEPGVAVTDD